jgi:hypothetical protein
MRIALVLWLLSPSLAFAQDREAEARALFQAAELAYHDGRFEDAELRFRQSYELSGRSDLLHNIAVSAERARHDQAAVEAYRAYLDAQPHTPRRARVEARISALNASIEAAARHDAVVQAPPVERAPPEVPEESLAPWLVLGASVVVAIAGVILIGAAAADVAAIDGAQVGSMWRDYEARYARTEAMSITGAVIVAAGLVGVAASILWRLWNGGDDAPLAWLDGSGVRGVW